MSEYACKLRLIVSQTQVDFKAGEYIDPAYITYIHDRVLRQLYKKPKCGKSQKIGRNICSEDELDQIGKGEGSVGNSDHHYIPGLPVEHPMTPDVFQEQLGNSGRIQGGDCGYGMNPFRQAIHHHKGGIVPLGVQEFSDHVYGDTLA